MRPKPPLGHRQVLEGEAKLDSWRSERTGFPEVVLGEGKTPEQIAAILRKMGRNDQVAMATRVAPQVRATGAKDARHQTVPPYCILCSWVCTSDLSCAQQHGPVYRRRANAAVVFLLYQLPGGPSKRTYQPSCAAGLLAGERGGARAAAGGGVQCAGACAHHARRWQAQAAPLARCHLIIEALLPQTGGSVCSGGMAPRACCHFRSLNFLWTAWVCSRAVRLNAFRSSHLRCVLNIYGSKGWGYRMFTLALNPFPTP